MTLKEIADQLESCGYVCEAGKLEMNEAFIALRKYAQQEQPNEAADCETGVEEYEKMTIEAAIKHCEEVSRRSPCTPCEREHMQLAAWLTELVSLRAQHEQPVVVHGKINYRNRPEHYVSYKLSGLTEGGDPLYKREYRILENNPIGYCSKCRKRLCSRFANYCPNCGAKMDGACQKGDRHE